jgi:hypothetical protein
MQRKTMFKVTIIFPTLCLAALPLMAQQATSQQSTGDPVADAARKARAQKKDEPKPKRVYTDDDVKPAVATPPTPSTGTGAAGDTAGTAADAKKNPDGTGGRADAASDKNSETAWRTRFKKQRDDITRAEQELDVLQRESQKQQLEYYPDPQKAMVQQNTRKDINETNAKIEAKKQEVTRLKQGLDDMQDALRKAGGDPGWGN